MDTIYLSSSSQFIAHGASPSVKPKKGAVEIVGDKVINSYALRESDISVLYKLELKNGFHIFGDYIIGGAV
jgi:hypothetical protein